MVGTSSNLHAARASGAEEQERSPASVPMYVAAFAAAAAGLLAVGLVLEDPAFTNLTLGLTVAGFIVSYLCRRCNLAPKSVEVPAAVLCVALAALAFTSDRLLPFLAPAGVGDDRAK